MRINNSILLLSLFILIPAISFSQKKKSDEEMAMTPEPIYVEGIVYSLPRTGFNIKVNTEKRTFVPGPYAAYAEKYLGIKNSKTTPETSWVITGVQVEPFTEPDPNAVFKTMNVMASQISQLSNGIITGIHAEGQIQPIVLFGTDEISKQETAVNFTDLSSDDYYLTAVNPETGIEKTSFKTTEDKAREAADFLIRLRKKRTFTILTASDVVPEDGKGYEVFVKEAQRLEKEYIMLFTGKTSKNKHQFSFNFVPEGNDVKNEILFRFSEEKGIVSKSDISGKPIMISCIKDSGFSKTVGQLKKSDYTKAGKSGVYYRIPSLVELSISDGLATLYSGRATLPQFGAVAPLPENLLDGNFVIQFDPESGTLLKINRIK
ncbi:MAG: DUF4831 family protein [Prolixibacteraceae bacterium]